MSFNWGSGYTFNLHLKYFYYVWKTKLSGCQTLMKTGFFLHHCQPCRGFVHSNVIFLIILKWKKNLYSVYFKYCFLYHSYKVLRKSLHYLSVLLNGPRQANLVLIAYASSDGSGEPAHPRSLARTFAARSYQQWVKRNIQTESQIPGPSEWLGMRS